MPSRLACACVAAALVAACGGSDDGAGAPTSTAPPTASSTTVAPTSTAPPTGSTTTGAPATRPLVIDTDLASDDLVAILYLLMSPAVDVKAITVSGTGEVHCDPGVAIAAGLVELAGRSGVSVACGRETPLQGAHAFPDEWRVAADEAYGLELPTGDTSAATRGAVGVLTDVIGTSPTPVAVLTLGPLTNLAEVLQVEPSLVERIASVHMMGGALDVDGNVGAESAIGNVGAEWNVYIDPHAMGVVLESGLPLALVPLDATNDFPVTLDVVAFLAANAHTPAAQASHQLLAPMNTPYLWDTLTALVLTDERLATTWKAEHLVIDETEGRESGRLTRSTDGAPVRVALMPNVNAAIERLARTLDGVAPDEPLVTPTTLAPLASVSLHFDGTACTYDGPATLPAGPIAISYGADAGLQSVGAVVRLQAGVAFEDLLAWVEDNPGLEAPPMTDRAEAIETTRTVVLEPGTWTTACLDVTQQVGVPSKVAITVG